MAIATIQKFLSDSDGLGWSTDIARRAALALVSVNADTTGLVVERAPGEVGFCHASLRDHLAGFHLSTWPFQHLVEFARTHASSTRWHDALLSTLHFLRRPDEIADLLAAFGAEHSSGYLQEDARALAAEAACLGSISTAIAERLESWAPSTSEWRSDIYGALASWTRTSELERVLWRGLFADDRSNRVCGSTFSR